MIDGHLPLFHFSEAAAIRIDAPPDAVYDAVGKTTLGEVSAARRALGLLRWFSLLPFISRGALRAPGDGPLVTRLEAAGFTRLGEMAARELVLGAVVPRARSPGDFRERVLRGEAALVLSVHLDRDEGLPGKPPSTRLAVELRASIPDETARRRYAPRAEMARFAIRRMLADVMSAVKRRAEESAGNATRGRGGA